MLCVSVADGLRIDKRSVSAKYKGIAVLVLQKEILRADHRVSCSETLFLFPYFAAFGCLLYVVAACDDTDFFNARRARRINYPAQHRLSGHFAKHFGVRRVHPLSLAGGENHAAHGVCTI